MVNHSNILLDPEITEELPSCTGVTDAIQRDKISPPVCRSKQIIQGMLYGGQDVLKQFVLKN